MTLFFFFNVFQKGSDRMNELYHHGVKGQKWGVRRHRNPDGSLTNSGKKRVAKLNVKINDANKRATEKFNSSTKIFQGEKSISSKSRGLSEYQNAIINKAKSDLYRKKLRDMGVNKTESLKVRAAEYEAGKAFAKNYGNKKIEEALANRSAIIAGMEATQAHQRMVNQQMIDQQIINQQMMLMR